MTYDYLYKVYAVGEILLMLHISALECIVYPVELHVNLEHLF